MNLHHLVEYNISQQSFLTKLQFIILDAFYMQMSRFMAHSFNSNRQGGSTQLFAKAILISLEFWSFVW